MEHLGRKPKFWFIRNGERFLFKADARGTGEDWAEVIASRLCQRLGLPYVRYGLAGEWHEGVFMRHGVVCRNMAPPPLSLILGNQLLFERDPAYPAQERYRLKQHTFQAVCDVLEELPAPAEDWLPERPDGVGTALDVFAGYVLLDALIANQDRHHENWGILRRDHDVWLAPTFDHGSGLARGITDPEREERLTTKDRNRNLEAYTAKARSAIFAAANDRKAIGTFELFERFANRSPTAAGVWQNRVAEIHAKNSKI